MVAPKAVTLDNSYLANSQNYGIKLENDWLAYGSKISKRNDAYVYYSFHAIVGQLFRDKYYFMLDELKIDMCTPLIILQDTGSGKTVLKHTLQRLCRDLKLNYKDVSVLTAGAMIGTSIYDSKSGNTKIIFGYLKDTNVFVCDEADALFGHLNDEVYRDIAMALQKTADSVWQGDTHIHKKLTQGEPVDYDANCTSILGSYIPKSFNDLATTTGLFPRHVTLVRHIPLEERIAVIDELVDSINIARDKAYDDEYNRIVGRLICMRKNAGNNAERIEFTNEAKERIKNEVNGMVDVVRDSSLLTRHVLGGFLPRYAIMLMKLSCHNAILRNSKQVEVMDVARVAKRFIIVWQTLTAYLEMSLILNDKDRMIFNGRIHSAVQVWHELRDKNEEGIVKYIKDDGFYVRFETIIEQLRTNYAWGDCSLNAAREYFLTTFIKKKDQVDPKAFFQRIEHGSNKVVYIKLVRDLIL